MGGWGRCDKIFVKKICIMRFINVHSMVLKKIIRQSIDARVNDYLGYSTPTIEFHECDIDILRIKKNCILKFKHKILDHSTIPTSQGIES